MAFVVITVARRIVLRQKHFYEKVEITCSIFFGLGLCTAGSVLGVAGADRVPFSLPASATLGLSADPPMAFQTGASGQIRALQHPPAL